MRGWAWQRREAARSPGARPTLTFSFFLPGAPFGRATPSGITIARVLPARAPPTNVARVASVPRLDTLNERGRGRRGRLRLAGCASPGSATAPAPRPTDPPPPPRPP